MSQVLAQPAQVGIGQVDTGGRARASEGGLHRGRTGIAKQVEEILACRLPIKPATQGPMVQEQARVQVVVQVDQQSRLPLGDADELPPAGLLLVLLAAALAAPLFVGDRRGGHLQRLRQGRPHLFHAALRRGWIDAPRSLVLGHVNLVAVDIHGHRVLRHVGVVEAITADVLPLHPVCQPLAILAQPVGEHAATLGQGRLSGSRCGAACPGSRRGPG